MLLEEKSNVSIKKMPDRAKQELLKLKNKNGRIIPKEIKKVIELVYLRKPEHLADDTTDVFEILRLCIVVGLPFLVHPALGIVGWITDRLIKEKVEENNKEFYLSKYTRQIESIDKRMLRKDLTKDEMASLKDLKSKLENDKRNLEDYFQKIERYKTDDSEEDGF